MIGLDTLQGFILLLILPLVYWQQRRSSARRVTPLALLPVLTEERPAEPPPSRRRFHLNRDQRFLILAAAMVCLVLAFNGLHFLKVETEPGRWLILFDNSPGSSARLGTRSVLEEMKKRTEALARRTHDDDRFTLVITSPAVLIADSLDRNNFVSRLSGTEPAAVSPSVETLAATVRVMQDNSSFKGTILVSPRSMFWKQALGMQGSSGPDITVPDGQVLAAGNAGFSLLDIHPVAGGIYDIYGKVVASGVQGESLDVLLSSGENPPIRIKVPLDENGEGELVLSEVQLAAGESILEVEIEDNLSGDNSIVITTQKRRPLLTARIQGRARDFIRIGLGAFDGVSVLPENRGSGTPDVIVHDKTVPGSRLTAPTLVIFPPEPFEPFRFVSIWATPMAGSFHPGHPITRNARFNRFRTAKVLQFTQTEGFDVLATADGIPLILAGERDGHRLVVWTFDPEDNGIYLDPAFPVLLRDTLVWLSRSGEARIGSESCLSVPGQGSGVRGDCAGQIRQGGIISVPDLTKIMDGPDGEKQGKRKDLGKSLLLIALLLLSILAVERAAYREPIF